jgi:hypothetical protein
MAGGRLVRALAGTGTARTAGYSSTQSSIGHTCNVRRTMQRLGGGAASGMHPHAGSVGADVRAEGAVTAGARHGAALRTRLKPGSLRIGSFHVRPPALVSCGTKFSSPPTPSFSIRRWAPAHSHSHAIGLSFPLGQTADGFGGAATTGQAHGRARIRVPIIGIRVPIIGMRCSDYRSVSRSRSRSRDRDRDRRRRSRSGRCRTACNIRHVGCNIEYATCNLQHATSNVQHATCNMQRAT